MRAHINEDLAKLNSIIELYKPISFFGSARLKSESVYYKEAKKLAIKCAQAGFCVISGGGGGIMAAANEGAKLGAQDLKLSQKEKDKKSVGFNIYLPFEQKSNDFIGYNITFENLSIRKMALIEKSLAFVVFPGGYGTLDEFLEILTLKQLGFKNVPIFAFGSEFWGGFDEFIKKSLLAGKLISAGDERLYEISDDLEFIFNGLKAVL